MTDERVRRVGQNEALYRKVNEEIEAINTRASTHEFSIICECGELDCRAPISISRERYERARADPTRFILLPGHQMEDELEIVVETTRAYVIVEKTSREARKLARGTNP
jgi:hypothetical protein